MASPELAVRPAAPTSLPRARDRVLVALGGNAMTGPGGDASPDAQRAAVELAMDRVAALIAGGVEVVITHGNGPQVGNLLLKNELAAHAVPPVPLDWCVAQTAATVGLLIMNALDRRLTEHGIDRRAAVVLTRTVVDPRDPAFGTPTKPIGRYLPPTEAAAFVRRGQIWEDRGPRGWRRVVASPDPLEILDAGAVATLLAAGFVVVAAGGGGVPVVADGGGLVHGVEAVVDKDLGAMRLALAVGATSLLIATDVDHVVVGFGTAHARPLARIGVEELRGHLARGEFARGSMGPKVQAAIRFVESGGRRAMITSLDQIAEAAAGRAGTIVEP